MPLPCRPGSGLKFHMNREWQLCYYFRPVVKPEHALLRLALTDPKEPDVDMKATEQGSRLCNHIQRSSGVSHVTRSCACASKTGA